MNDLQISAALFLVMLGFIFFHFSGYSAAKGMAKNGDWTAIGAIPLVLASIGALMTLVITLAQIFSK